MIFVPFIICANAFTHMHTPQCYTLSAFPCMMLCDPRQIYKMSTSACSKQNDPSTVHSMSPALMCANSSCHYVPSCSRDKVVSCTSPPVPVFPHIPNWALARFYFLAHAFSLPDGNRLNFSFKAQLADRFTARTCVCWRFSSQFMIE